ncbi:RagB/SusD family nutrient uptake outer membrane protein [Pontibacter burrus]|uniref:RagB/SusD family nutrient uptake outer membrane protein n=1 Tax=Pontibacter burrus TaxID=2704466 RepID=A0A6B3LVE1_9BACT|nr:RagB/SusD family nutrient uptake outer membrane protein [Pontibacter burrus]NEM97431.1 RagB/SusD family nutrient uptake outer membrane protein [Pontibacter burrus]
MIKPVRKTISTSLLLGALAFAAPSCDIIEKEPIENLSPDSAFTTPQRIEKAVVGMYDDTQNAEFLGGRALIYSDIRGADTDPATYFGNIGLFNTLSSDGTVTNAWTGGYRAIYTTNLFLQALEANRAKVPTEVLAKQYEAEAKFLRALNHWYLVNLFAQPYTFTTDGSHLGIPIALKAFDASTAFTPEAQLARSSVAQVYAQIEKDLQFAAQNLPTRTGVMFSDVARATKGAAEALLMRLYLYKGDNVKALEQATKVDAMGYKLNSSPVTVFSNYTTWESIFSVAHNLNDNPNTNHALGQHYGRRRDISVDPYLSLFPANSTDLRVYTLTKKEDGKTYTLKYTDNSQWVPVIRYAEVVLTKAEALAKQSLANGTVNETAVAFLNEIRTRANASTFQSSDFSNNSELLEAVLLERRRELAFEGHGMFDLLRNKKDIPANGNNKLQVYGSDKTILPIPLVETQANPNLKQNPGY